MSMYSDGIIFKFRFQKSRFIEEIGKVSGYFFGGVYLLKINKRVGPNKRVGWKFWETQIL